MSGSRSYGDLCGIARALDVVGERWALLMVRELVFGPKRFVDLHRGLSGVSHNVLSQRLRELEDSGVVARRVLGPPAGARVYELTPRGRELEPVLLALGRWGSSILPASTSATELSPDALAFALKTTFAPAAAGDLCGRYQLRLGSDAFSAEVADGRLHIARGEISDAAATITCAVHVLQDLVFGGRDLDAAVHAADATVTGDASTLRRFLRCFDDSRKVEAETGRGDADLTVVSGGPSGGSRG
ncbi:HxlR family transcriptional regulator [Nonomuraea fuscirosea]|uniref:HxlR family transcriptional regulator n=1 Tax=Nonomuraea fuscirosea TaxID=1291556 RepID=A0A2T0MQ51_9ACTN|nr:winged helix-turn-helix transcriptional regulator [Nonomuraea fuscirosea]PRX60261.1 HxlR family transcriptional regulator [Nonomuraea fuscirosea]